MNKKNRFKAWNVPIFRNLFSGLKAIRVDIRSIPQYISSLAHLFKELIYKFFHRNNPNSSFLLTAVLVLCLTGLVIAVAPTILFSSTARATSAQEALVEQGTFAAHYQLNGNNQETQVTWKVYGSEAEGYTLKLSATNGLAYPYNYAQDKTKAPWINYPLSAIEIEEGVAYIDPGFFKLNEADDTNTRVRFNIKNSTFDSFKIPGTVTSVKQFLDTNTSAKLPRVAIKELTFGEGVTEIGSSAFEWLGITKLNLPNSLVRIEYSAFKKNNITELNLPENLQSIKNEAFANNMLKSVDLPSRATDNTLEAFKGNYPLTRITTSENATFSNLTIQNTPFLDIVYNTRNANGSFGYDTSFNNLIVSKNVDSIRSNLLSSFNFAIQLKYGASLNRPRLIFEGSNYLTLADSITEGTKQNFKQVVPVLANFNSNKKYYVDEQGLVFELGENSATLVYASPKQTNVTIPASVTNEDGIQLTVTTIAPRAFSEAYNLETLTIPTANQIDVSSSAFYGAENLTSINDKSLINEVSVLFKEFTPDPISFWNTKLQGSKASPTREMISINNGIRVDMRAVRDNEAPELTQSAHEYDFYTGENGNITLSVSQPNEESDANKEMRMYVFSTSSNLFFPYGDSKTIKTITSSGEETFTLTRKNTDVPGLSYYVLPKLEGEKGASASFSIPVGSYNQKEPNSAYVWLATAESSEDHTNDILPIDRDLSSTEDNAQHKFIKLNWKVLPRTYDVQAKASKTNQPINYCLANGMYAYEYYGMVGRWLKNNRPISNNFGQDDLLLVSFKFRFHATGGLVVNPAFRMYNANGSANVYVEPETNDVILEMVWPHSWVNNLGEEGIREYDTGIYNLDKYPFLLPEDQLVNGENKSVSLTVEQTSYYQYSKPVTTSSTTTINLESLPSGNDLIFYKNTKIWLGQADYGKNNFDFVLTAQNRYPNPIAHGFTFTDTLPRQLYMTGEQVEAYLSNPLFTEAVVEITQAHENGTPTAGAGLTPPTVKDINGAMVAPESFGLNTTTWGYNTIYSPTDKNPTFTTNDPVKLKVSKNGAANTYIVELTRGDAEPERFESVSSIVTFFEEHGLSFQESQYVLSAKISSLSVAPFDTKEITTYSTNIKSYIYDREDKIKKELPSRTSAYNNVVFNDLATNEKTKLPSPNSNW